MKLLICFDDVQPPTLHSLSSESVLSSHSLVPTALCQGTRVVLFVFTLLTLFMRSINSKLLLLPEEALEHRLSIHSAYDAVTYYNNRASADMHGHGPFTHFVKMARWRPDLCLVAELYSPSLPPDVTSIRFLSSFTIVPFLLVVFGFWRWVKQCSSSSQDRHGRLEEHNHSR